MEPDDPHNPAQLRQGMLVAEAQPGGDVGQICENCPDNWVEAGAVDEVTGQPLPGIGYRIYDLASGDQVASGVLDDEGRSPRHHIPTPATQLYVVFGTEEAMDAAEEQIGERQREVALQANARPDWNGIPAGLDEQGFNQAFNERVLETGRMPARSPSLIGASLAGWQGIFDYVFSGFDGDAAQREFYLDERARSFDEYELVTGARDASRWESLGGGAGQGVSFGFGEEGMAQLDSWFSGRSYEESVAARRQIIEAQRIANPGHFVGGEIAGAVPTIFVPVGGAAANAARAGRGVTGAMRAGGATGAATGALSGAGHDEGGVLDRLDGAAVGGLTGGMAGAVLSGAGVLIARGVSRTRIWGRIIGPRPGSLSNRAAREWYLEQERLIPSQLDRSAPLQAQARQAHQLRNAARSRARELMADQNLASQLARENPNLTWEQLVARTEAKGFTGDAVFEEIVESSQRSRASVNQRLGLE